MTLKEVAVLIEGFRSEFRTFGEGLDAVRAKVDSMFDQLGKVTEDVFVIKADITVLKADVSILKADIAEIKEMLKNQNKRISQLEAVR